MKKFLDAALNGAAAYTGYAYFFKGPKYYRYDWDADKGDDGYPLGLDEWGFPAPFDKGVDAAVEGRFGYEKKAYFFKDDKYLAYDWVADKVLSGYPKGIIEEWGVPKDFFTGKPKIDAAVNGAGDYARYCYLFSGSKWIQIDWKDEEQPKSGTIEKDWGLPPEFAKGMDAALSGWGKKYGNKAYFFSDKKYARYDWGKGCDLKNEDLAAWKIAWAGASPEAPKGKILGLLLAAYNKKAILKPEWKEITVSDKNFGDLKVTVATDAFRTPVGDQKAVRLGVSYLDTIQICRGMECVVPNVTIFDAMWKNADIQLPNVAMEISASIERSIQFSSKIDELLDGKSDPKKLVFGAWKLWILDKEIANSKYKQRGCVNRGFWDPKKKDWIQKLGIFHPNDHADYSQVLQPVKRMAKAKDGSDVDLLKVYAQTDNIPVSFLDVFDPAKDK